MQYLHYVLFVLIAIVPAYFLIRVARNRGVRGALFGAPVARTLGELDLGRRGIVRTGVRVCILEARSETSPGVGLEVGMTSITGFRYAPSAALTADQARRLARLLVDAAAEARVRE